MTESSVSKVAILWSMVVLLFLGVLTILTFALQPRFYRSPTKVIPADEEWYDNVFDPTRRVAIPDLPSYPLVPAKVESVPSSMGGGQDVTVSFDGPYPKFPSENLLYEIFPSDSTGVATLPNGNRLSLSAVAIAMPSDAEWNVEERPPKTTPDWREPYTGAPLSLPDGGDPFWSQPRAVPGAHPMLHFRVKVEGEAPIRWLGPAVHDARTKRSVSAVSGPVYQGDGFFSIDLDIWHQTPLDLGVEFYFGDPEIQTLPLEKDAEVRFGDDAVVQVKEFFPNGYRIARWPGYEASFSLYSKPPKDAQPGFALQVWPPCNTKLIEYKIDPAREPYRIFGSWGLVGYRFPKGVKAGPRMHVYRYPRLGRAIFHLPAIPRLPEASNLFNVPISKIHVIHSGTHVLFASEAAEVKYDYSIPSGSFPKSEVPVFFTNTTPAKLLVEIEKETGEKLYYDRSNAVISTRKPPGVLEQWKEWFDQNVKRRFF